MCSNSPPEAWQSPAQVRRSWGANFATPMLLANSFTDVPNRLDRHPISPCLSHFVDPCENSFPRSIAAAVSQSFISVLTQSSTQTPQRLHLPTKKNRPEHKQSDAAQDASDGTSRALVPIMKTRLRVEQWRFLPNRVLVRMAD